MKRFLGAKKIARIYIDNQDKYNGRPLWEEILKKVKELGLAGATVFKGVAGIGAHSQIRSFNVWTLSQELPLIIEIIDDEDKIRNFAEYIDEMLDNGLITITETEVIKYKHKNFNEQEEK
jgi:PII-like signaling protein